MPEGPVDLGLHAGAGSRAIMNLCLRDQGLRFRHLRE